MINVIERPATARPMSFSAGAVEAIGHVVLRYGLALFLVSGGLAKFTSSEADFIHPLMAHSPLFAWVYAVTSVQGASNLIGIVELIVGMLLAVHCWRPRLAVLGGLGAALEFVFTVSFVFTTPNVSTEMAGFLSKDVMLFGAAVWATGESLRLATRGRHP